MKPGRLFSIIVLCLFGSLSHTWAETVRKGDFCPEILKNVRTTVLVEYDFPERHFEVHGVAQVREDGSYMLTNSKEVSPQFANREVISFGGIFKGMKVAIRDVDRGPNPPTGKVLHLYENGYAQVERERNGTAIIAVRFLDPHEPEI